MNKVRPTSGDNCTSVGAGAVGFCSRIENHSPLSSEPDPKPGWWGETEEGTRRNGVFHLENEENVNGLCGLIGVVRRNFEQKLCIFTSVSV